MTRCIGYAASSPPLPRKSATAVKPGCVDSSTLVTPTGRYAPLGTQPKRYEASTGSTLRSLLSDTPSNSQTTSNTNPAHPRSTSSVAPSPAGPPKSPTGTSPKVTNRRHRSPQQPHQTNQTSSLRVTQLRELPNPGPPLRRKTQLGPTRIGHSPLRRDEPDYGPRIRADGCLPTFPGGCRRRAPGGRSGSWGSPPGMPVPNRDPAGWQWWLPRLIVPGPMSDNKHYVKPRPRCFPR